MNNTAVQIDLSAPTVTVIVSSYNRPRLIRDALDSIVDQVGVSVEVIVADDHSNQETQRVLSQYNVRVVQPAGGPPDKAERQQGQRCAVAINAALPQARGKYLAFLPDDDFLLPKSLACRAAFLDANDEATYGRVLQGLETASLDPSGTLRLFKKNLAEVKDIVRFASTLSGQGKV